MTLTHYSVAAHLGECMVAPGMTRVLNRSAHLRSTESLARERAHPQARFVAIWRGQTLLDDKDPPHGVWLPLKEADSARLTVFLGRNENDHPRFAVDFSDTDHPESLGFPGTFRDLFQSGWFMDPAEFQTLGYAKGMMHWHHTAVHCERCGARSMLIEQGGFKRRCQKCSAQVFPRSDPAVMVLVTLGNECLLARQPRFPDGMYSALAGFAEPGESLEECVVRETKEEVGLDVATPRYLASQPWPFPRSLMVGFRVEAPHKDYILDKDELEDGRWFSREELQTPKDFRIPPRISLANQLIRSFVELG